MDITAPIGPAEMVILFQVKPRTVAQWAWRRILPPRDYTINGKNAWKYETIIKWGIEKNKLETCRNCNGSGFGRPYEPFGDIYIEVECDRCEGLGVTPKEKHAEDNQAN